MMYDCHVQVSRFPESALIDPRRGNYSDGSHTRNHCGRNRAIKVSKRAQSDTFFDPNRET